MDLCLYAVTVQTLYFASSTHFQNLTVPESRHLLRKSNSQKLMDENKAGVVCGELFLIRLCQTTRMLFWIVLAEFPAF